MKISRWLAAVISLSTLVALSVAETTPSRASDPAEQSVTVPTQADQTKTVTWTGSIPAGANATNRCASGANEDHHQINVAVPQGTYQSLVVDFTFSISWEPVTGAEDTNDEILSVFDFNGKEIGSSDGSATTEVVTDRNSPPGRYDVVACGFANALPQDYEGKLVIETKVIAPEKSLPSAKANGLKFSASVPADPQRDEAEPLIVIDKDGKAYTCGPTGFSNAADYAQVSTDDGRQFHILGEPPRGQQGSGGGGDCSMAQAPDRSDPDFAYNYAYSGLGPLTGFTTATSSDGGHTLQTSPDNGSIPGVDRQWETFLDENTVLLNYNRQEPRYVEVLKSTDGGLTFDPSCCKATSNPEFPGPLKTLEAKFNPEGSDKGRVAYFPWTSQSGTNFFVNLAVSYDGGTTWNDCVAAKTKYDMSTSFPVADNDTAGNIYVAYTEQGEYHTYMTALKRADLAKCDEGPDAQPKKNPGFSTPVQVDRNKVRTTVFPWIAARGEPGRVAVTFFGTESQGDPNTGDFKASWNVYVNQSLNALDGDASFSQVKATTHPFHYDSICLNGLGCDLSVPPGDRTLADFFAIDLNPNSGRLMVVYNRANKKPGEEVGHVGTPMVFTQSGGPSNKGGKVDSYPSTLRSKSNDDKGDALSAYSSLGSTPNTTNEPALDFLSAKIGPELNLAKGNKKVDDGGFTVTLKVDDLSDGALTGAMADMGAQSLLWVFNFVNGYQASAVQANWNPGQGFSFGYNDYTTGSAQCGSNSEKCIVYPGDTPVQGKVDQESGTIRLSVPRMLLRRLSGSEADGKRPKERKAKAGSRLYDGTAFSFGNTQSPTQSVQQFLYTIDNTPAMDFKIPGASKTPSTSCTGPNVIKGDDKDNVLVGTSKDEVFCAFGGDDVVKGGGGNDIILGGAGNDKLKGGSGRDLIIGKAGADSIFGGGGKDTLRGGGGKDTINGNDRNDLITGGGDNDTLRGNKGFDTMRGGVGSDVLQGGYGNDVLRGNRGSDTLKGFNGNDLLNGGTGRDRCKGGRGNDKVKNCEG